MGSGEWHLRSPNSTTLLEGRTAIFHHREHREHRGELRGFGCKKARCDTGSSLRFHGSIEGLLILGRWLLAHTLSVLSVVNLPERESDPGSRRQFLASLLRLSSAPLRLCASKSPTPARPHLCSLPQPQAGTCSTSSSSRAEALRRRGPEQTNCLSACGSRPFTPENTGSTEES